MIRSFLIFLLLMPFAFCAFAQDNQALLGKWQATDNKEMIVEIYKANNGLYYGKKADGNLILKELKYNSSSKTYSGIMQIPDADVTMKVEITLESQEKFKMIATKFFISKTRYFNKIK